MSLKLVTLKFAVACLKFCNRFIGKKQRKNQISIISRQSDNVSTDIALLSDFIRTSYPELKLKVLVRFIEPGLLGKIGYVFHMITQMKAIAESKVVILDGYCITASVLKHHRDTKIVQMWHSMAAIKKFGHQTIDKADGHSHEVAEIMCMHKNYDYVICPSMETGRFFCKGFNCHEEKLVLRALPRIDYIKECMKEENASVLRERLPKGKEVLLYAPTFRKKAGLDATELLKAIDYDKFTLIVKPHPLYAENLQEIVRRLNLDNKVFLDESHGTFEWLGACDRIITDYSAIAVESLVTDKPLYFYLYDLAEYEQSVGLNVWPMNEMPKATALSADELAIKLNEEYDFNELEKFRNKYLTADTVECTRKLGEFIYELTC